MSLIEKYEGLKEYLRGLGNVGIAFSGGVDSTLLLKAAVDALGNNAVAITLKSPIHLQWEIGEAIALTKEIGAKHVILQVKEIIPEIKYNPTDRCYLCKSAVFEKIINYGKDHSIQHIADGSNLDDTMDYRPGMRALKERKVRSPLLELGFTKNEIRALSAELKLPTWDKPAYACILSRIQYGQEVTEKNLRMIESGELYMIRRGFRTVRVRLHDQLARIEVDPHELKQLLDIDLIRQIREAFKEIGFQYITLDLEGYRMGSQNEVIL